MSVKFEWNVSLNLGVIFLHCSPLTSFKSKNKYWMGLFNFDNVIYIKWEFFIKVVQNVSFAKKIIYFILVYQFREWFIN